MTMTPDTTHRIIESNNRGKSCPHQLTKWMRGEKRREGTFLKGEDPDELLSNAAEFATSQLDTAGRPWVLYGSRNGMCAVFTDISTHSE